MKKTITTMTATQVVELGKATSLTLGGGSGGTENRHMPFGVTSRTNHVVELGKATKLTLGGGSGGVENRHQPFGVTYRTEK